MSEERLKRTGEVFLVPFENIIVDDEINTARLDFGNIQELADSIEECGLRIPLLVKKTRGENKFVLVQGKRRLRAIETLIEKGVDIPGVKCFLAPPNYTIENSLFDQIVMNDGKPYSNLEQGIVFSQLVDRGYNVSEISKKVAKSVTHITSCIEIASLPKKVRDLVGTGAVSGLTAVELSKTVGNEDELIKELEAAVDAAPVSSDGSKKKVTKKNIKQIASASPLKKMEAAKKILEEKDICNEKTILLEKLISWIKADENTESIAELFY